MTHRPLQDLCGTGDGLFNKLTNQKYRADNTEVEPIVLLTDSKAEGPWREYGAIAYTLFDQVVF